MTAHIAGDPMTTIAFLRIAALAGLALAAIVGPAAAQPAPAAAPPRPLRVIAFEGGHNLPIWAAQRQGFFEDNGVKVALSFTPSSVVLVSGMFDNKSDIACLAIDNVIAYQEGQGEAKIPDNPDLFAFLGIDDGLLSLATAPAVKRFADLKGKTLTVDAMTTGYAFVLRELIQRAGLKESDVQLVSAGGTGNRYRDLVAGKHDGTLLRTPFELLVKDRGFHLLATGDSLGPYLGTVAAARRSWAHDNEAALIGFIRGYRAGMAWVSDPKNRAIAEAILLANTKDMTPALAKRSYDALFAPRTGFLRDGALDPARIKTVLALRSKFAEPKKPLDDPAKYIDASYRDKALAAPPPAGH
ncbi:MAG: ABC transporter substrate-binding protein [Deltaproteobacteria bacterium]|nr:MAG: ABC transporter substrate-binding protein [Deltaproteobacteria bacterium]